MNIKKNNSGIILLSVLWILAILSLLAMNLGKNSSLEVSLIRGAVGRLKAYAAARAGVSYTQNLMRKNIPTSDNLYQCGITIPDNKTPKDIFGGIEVGKDTHFDITYPATGYNETDQSINVFGVSDEQAKINLNDLTLSNSKIFSELIQQFGVSKNLAESLAVAVVNWRQNVVSSSNGSDGLKHMPFDHIQELLLINGITQELFDKIKNYVTVFPKDGDGNLKVNYNTASNPVIRAVIKGVTQNTVDTSKDLINLRNGSDQVPFTDDDGKQTLQSAAEAAYSNSLIANHGVQNSQYFNIRSVGTDKQTGASAIVHALVFRDPNGDLKIVSWSRE